MRQGSPTQSFALNLPGRIIAISCAYPIKTLFIVFCITLFCGLAALTNLQFKSDRSDLISPDAKFHQRWMEYCERFRESNELVILVEGSDAVLRKQAVTWAEKELLSRPEQFKNVMTIDSFFAPDEEQEFSEQVQLLTRELQMTESITQSNAERSPLLSLLSMSEQELSYSDNNPTPDPLLVTNRIAKSLERSLQEIDHSFKQYFPDSATANEEFWHRYVGSPQRLESNQIESAAHSTLDQSTVIEPETTDENSLITLVPQTDTAESGNKYQKSLTSLHEIVSACKQRFPQLNIGVTGIPQLEYEEMSRSQADMTLASLLSTAGVILLLIFGYRGLSLPIICCITVGASMIWTLGATTFLIGHLNILSMAFAAILVGLGIDFGIHLLSSYQDFLSQGKPVETSLSLAGHTVGRGIVTAALTTSVAFLCAGFTEFPGVAELGIIAGVGVLLAVAATFFIFPPLVVLANSRQTTALTHKRIAPTIKHGAFMNLLRFSVVERPFRTLLLTLLPISGLCLHAWEWNSQGPDCLVKYDANLLNMQPRDLPALETRNALTKNQDNDVLYAVTWYASREQAIEQADRFRKLETVGEVIELASEQTGSFNAFPGMPEGGPAAGRNLQALMASVQRAVSMDSPTLTSIPHNPSEVGQQLESILANLTQFETILSTQLRLEVDHFLDIFAQQPFEIQIQILGAAEREMIRSLWSEVRLIAVNLQEHLELQQMYQQDIVERFRSSEGDWLLQIKPNIDVWNDAGLQQFVTDLRTVDNNVTGVPIQNFEASRQLKESYLNAAAYASLAIVLILMLDVCHKRTIVRVWPLCLLAISGIVGLRIWNHWELASELTLLKLLFAFTGLIVAFSLVMEKRRCVIGLLALLPPAIGAAMLLGSMSLFGISFTPANLIALPLVLGIGIDDGVHVIHDFYRSKKRYAMSGNTCRALVLTTLTSMVGFGSLAFASHRGLAGLGQVVVTGIASCLIVSIIILPALLSWLFDEQNMAHSVDDDLISCEDQNQILPQNFAA
ncbi:MMPL family transporter [uncultured Rubinisphaera sp.]|uniref:MMPL family transporter n=1 Tax=uncultured Rubinisphaera sp. TaxID=1678686 RepID=UPI0030DA1E4B